MVTCKCGESDSGKFSKSNKKKTGLQGICKQCSSAWYRANRTKVKVQATASNRRRAANNRTIAWNHLLTHPCVDCGERDPIVLEFDHVRGEKLGTISVMIREAGTSALIEEISKCDIRCANCHRRKTAKDRRYWFDKLG